MLGSTKLEFTKSKGAIPVAVIVIVYVAGATTSSGSKTTDTIYGLSGVLELVPYNTMSAYVSVSSDSFSNSIPENV